MARQQMADRFDILDASLDDIYIVGDRRPVDDEAVHRLAQSVRSIGLRTPITIRTAEISDPDSGKALTAFALVTGRHRLEAYRTLGLDRIPAIVRECDELDAELWEIDENLIRAELSPSDRARYTARRKELYEVKHPDARAGIAGALAKHRATANLATASFAGATASATGASERAVRRDAERGAKVIDEVLDMVRGTALDTGSYLDRIKNLPPNDQVQAAKRDLSWERRKERETASAAPAPAREAKEPRDEPLSRMDRRKLELTIKDLRGTRKDLATELQLARAENARLRDRCQTLEHELTALRNRFGVPA